MPANLIAELRTAGLVTGSAPALTPLAGGVSSEIFLVTDDERRFVVKRALAKLRVKDDWFADVGRNKVEQDFFVFAARAMPESVPRILHASSEGGWFAMEFFGANFRPWKQDLLAGRADASMARLAGRTLSHLHALSWLDRAARATFDTQKNFHQLRIDPYLLSTAKRVSPLRDLLETEAARLAATRLALVHGDYSPKNLLVADDRLIVLDAEAAWFGDPAFDIAFLLCHLHLKALYHAATPKPFLTLIIDAWRAYAGFPGSRADSELEARTIRLTLCLLLARVHGKSPVEYLSAPAQSLINDFVCEHLPHPPTTIEALGRAWGESLDDVER